MQDPPFLEPVLITGADGFIGSHLAREMARLGCRPVLASRSPKGAEDRNGLLLKRVYFDLTDDHSIEQFIDSVRPATLIHLAGARGSAGAVECANLNFHATARLLGCATRAGVKRIVTMGSAEEYGDQAGPLAERLELNPTTPYGISKALATGHALMLHDRDACPVVVLRPFSVYGPGQPRAMFVAQAVAAALRNAPFEMSGGEQMRDLVYVDDIVRGILAAAREPGVEGRVINLGTGRPKKLKDVAALVWELSGARSPLLVGARPARPEELYDTWADTTAARRLLRWEAAVGIEEGLRRTIESSRGTAMKAQQCQAR